jgi:hypothetical protein
MRQILNYITRGFRLPRSGFLVSVACCSVISAKLAHVYSHLDTLSFPLFPVWGATILFYDIALVLLIRFLTGKSRRLWMTFIAWYLT